MAEKQSSISSQNTSRMGIALGDKLLRQHNHWESRKSIFQSRWNIIKKFVRIQNLNKSDSNQQFSTNALNGKINEVVNNIIAHTSPPNSQWFDIKFQDKRLMGIPAVQEWANALKEYLYAVFADPASKFYSSYNSMVNEWFVLGTACRYVTFNDKQGVVCYDNVSMDDITVGVSGFGEINRVFRKFELESRQAYDLWGNGLEKSQLEEIAKGNADGMSMARHTYIECVFPTEEVSQNQKEIFMYPYVSVVVDKTTKHIVSQKFVSHLPYTVSRFQCYAGDLYGSSKVWESIHNIQTLYKTASTTEIAMHYIGQPMFARENDFVKPNRMDPGSFITALKKGAMQIQPIHMYNDTVNALHQYSALLLQELETNLGNRVLAVQPAPNETAESVRERKAQSANALLPMISQLESEALNPIIHATVKIIIDRGMLPPIEAVLASVGINPFSIRYNFHFVGEMRRMQEMYILQNDDLLLQKGAAIAQFYPQVLQNLNFDAMFREASNILSNNPSILKSPEEVQKEREAQREAQEQQQQEEKTMRNIALASDMAAKMEKRQ